MWGGLGEDGRNRERSDEASCADRSWFYTRHDGGQPSSKWGAGWDAIFRTGMLFVGLTIIDARLLARKSDSGRARVAIACILYLWGSVYQNIRDSMITEMFKLQKGISGIRYRISMGPSLKVSK